MTTSAVKITSKGQVTIPREIRAKLKSNSVYFDVQGDMVIIRPVRDASASLKEYAKNAPQDMSIKEIKEKAWEEAVREKNSDNPA